MTGTDAGVARFLADVAAARGRVVASGPVELERPEDPADECGTCGDTGPRCRFGARSGPCSCWRGVPCRPAVAS